MHARSWRTLVVAVALVASVDAGLCCHAAEAQSGGGQPPAPSSDSKVTFTLYPLLLRAPIMGATINLPSVPAPPDGGGGGGADEASGSTDFSLNSAWMAGAAVESNRWFAETFGLYALLSANRSTPLVTVDSNTYFFNGRAGVRLFGGLSATAGFRRISADLDVTIERPSAGTTLQGHAKPALWDPLVGLDWRGRIGPRWRLAANVQGGGFGVGTDLDLSTEAYASWRPLRHIELRAGYTVLHYKMTLADVRVGSLDRTLISHQTLHGPEVGIGIPF
jgi:hypothetical protein